MCAAPGAGSCTHIILKMSYYIMPFYSGAAVQVCRLPFCFLYFFLFSFFLFYFLRSFVVKLYLHGCTPVQTKNPLILQEISGYFVQLSNLHKFFINLHNLSFPDILQFHELYFYLVLL